MDFYLGAPPDSDPTADGAATTGYDPSDLTTHGVIVGMTGSGKTGLGVIFLEEALRQGIPTLVIDPKGDMTNLVLTFPELRPEDFRPWIDESAAQKQGTSPDDEAAAEAEKWTAGLASWGLSGTDIAALRERSGMTIYTPGSQAGIPLDVIGELAAPDLSWDTDAEAMRDEIEGFVSGLLGLVDVEADPISSREHILLCNLIEHGWRSDQDLDLETLIGQIATPPIRKLGVFDVDTFFAEKDRMALAMKLNGLLASPSFATWMEGEPLDIETMLWRDGVPQAAIVYLAHLSDSERQFIVTTVLSRLITWMRSQPGSSELRVLGYMDEVFGFVPPTAEPPAKKPILTLLKQARAFGVGMLLSTQNPVDLDYKAMSNAGTWCIGRLQTERDKARIVEAVRAASGEVDVAAIDDMITGLGKRQFLLHNTREAAPEMFGTRWAMSYLRGPMTREEVERATAPRRRLEVPDEDEAPTAAEVPPTPMPPTPMPPTASVSEGPPEVAAGIAVSELHPAAAWAGEVGHDPLGTTLTPAIALTVEVHFDEARAELEHTETWEAVVYPAPGDARTATFLEVDHDARDFVPPGDGVYQASDAPLSQSSYFTKLAAAATRYLDRNETLVLERNRRLGATSRPGETPAEFRDRLARIAEDRADAEMAQLRDRYEARFRKAKRSYEDAVRKADAAAAELDAKRGDAIVGMGLDLLMGRKPRRRSNRSSTNRLRSAEDRVERARAAYEDLGLDLEDELAAIEDEWTGAISDIDEIEVGLEADDIRVTDTRVVWIRN
jgi:hypothetical protein